MNNNVVSVHNRSFLFSQELPYYLILILTVLAILLLGHPAYSANDDFAMMSIAAGRIDGIPDAHLVFTNSLIGGLLSALYATIKGFNWYTAYLILALLISEIVLMRSVLKLVRGSNFRVIVLLVFLVFSGSFIVLFNFTTIAILASFSGLLLFLVETLSGNGKPGFKILAVALVVLGGLIRVQALLYTAILAAPAFVFFMFRSWKLILPWLMAIAVLMGGALWYDNNSYFANANWQFFKVYNQERGAIHSTPKMAFGENAQLLSEIGWNRPAFDLFDKWIFIDDQVFTLKSLETINATYSASIHSVGEVFNTFVSLIRLRLVETILTLGVVAFSLFCVWDRGRIKKILVVAILLYVLLINILVAFALRMVDNIFYPSLFILCIACLVYVGVDMGETDMPRQRFRWIAIVAIGFVLFKSMGLYAIDQNNATNRERVAGIIASVQKSVFEQVPSLVIVQASTFPDIWISPFSAQGIPFAYLPTGWLIDSPPYRNILAQYGIQNPIDALASSEHIYYLGCDQDALVTYLAEVRHSSTKAVNLEQFETRYKGYDQIYLTMFEQD